MENVKYLILQNMKLLSFMSPLITYWIGHLNRRERERIKGRHEGTSSRQMEAGG